MTADVVLLGHSRRRPDGVVHAIGGDGDTICTARIDPRKLKTYVGVVSSVTCRSCLRLLSKT